MRAFSHIFKTGQELESFFQENLRPDGKNILIQLFCGTGDVGLVQNVLMHIARLLPEAKVIGASTAGEIIDGTVAQGSIVVSCAAFDHTCVSTYHVPDTSHQSGEFLVSQLVVKETKVLICFSESLQSDPESFLQGIASVNQSIPVIGGNAGDNNRFEQTYIIEGVKIYYSGVVAAALSGIQLHVNNAYSLNWLPIGREFVVTKAVGNRVYEIDHTPIAEICCRYLGKDTIQALPGGIIEFPLLKTVEHLPVARSIVAVHDDGSFQYAGNFQEGDRVRFAVGNIDAVFSGALKLQQDVATYPAEAIFVYSCTVRKLFLQDQIGTEFRLLNEIAPTSGFFTYGEYYHTKTTNQILNITTTALILSEGSQPMSIEVKPVELKVSTFKILTHLVNATQLELEKHINFLEQYKKVVDESSIISKTDPRGIITYANERFCDVSGYSREELIGENHNIIRHEDTPAEIFKKMWATISSGSPWRGIIKNRKKNGDSYYVDTMIMPLYDQNNQLSEYIAIRHDITKIILQEQRIRKQTTDELTGLPNRIQLLEDIKSTTTPTLIFLDIDNFSVVNDLYGIDTGDKILVQISHRLADVIAEDKCVLYRLGNDVFAILNDQRGCLIDREGVLDLQQVINKGFKEGGFEMYLSCSCGMAQGKESLFRHADIALHVAKERKSSCVMFDESLLNLKRHEQNFLWLKKLRNAFSRNRIVPFFQPIVNNTNGKIEKYESLVRLIQEDGAVASPFFFLDIAKKSKVYPELTRTVVKKTLRILQQTSCEISLNLSVEDILDENTIGFLLNLLEQSGVTDRVVLEITEGEGFENFVEVLSLASTIRKMGGKIAIDDFGTGYSNFSYLLKMQPDYIKIDGSIIKNIDSDPSAQAIAETIVSFSRKLNIKTIAEFVHSESVQAMVKEIGVDYSQGYLFGEPQAPEVIFPDIICF
jgi:PAS domain S-box-containing protein/diguanylate cyclase (GGDEF)-like protein